MVFSTVQGPRQALQGDCQEPGDLMERHTRSAPALEISLIIRAGPYNVNQIEVGDYGGLLRLPGWDLLRQAEMEMRGKNNRCAPPYSIHWRG